MIRPRSIAERWWAWQYQRRINRARKAWQASPRYAQIRACKHIDPRARGGLWPQRGCGGVSERCLACGVGIVTVPLDAKPSDLT